MQAKTALITGAGKVTGKHIALKLGEAGYDIGVTYVNSEKGAEDTIEKIIGMGRRAKAYKADT